MIKFEIIEKFGRKFGSFTFKGCGSIANSIRRILLDEIPSYGFDLTDCVVKYTDHMYNQTIMLNIMNVKVYEEGIYEIAVNNQTTKPIEITSDVIRLHKSNKPANVQKGVVIWNLAPNASINISNIKTTIGIGRQHAGFSRMLGKVSYQPTDTICVYYLKDDGFIDTNLKKIPYESHMDRKKQYIIWNKVGEKNMQKDDIEIAKLLERLPDKKYTFYNPETHISEDHIVQFHSTYIKEDAKAAVDTLIKAIEQKDKYTNSAFEVISYYITKEVSCAIFNNKIQDEDDLYTMYVDHVDAPKIIENAKKKAIETLKKIIW